MSYNGHKNWNHWNVSLWINNDEHLYNMAKFYIRHWRIRGKDYAAKYMLERLKDEGITHTPDGAPYSFSSIRAAMVGM
jgi:hypothetical protein